MTLLQISDLHMSQAKFNTMFGLEIGQVVMAGGKRPGQTAGLARYTVIAGKEGREHIIELGFGAVPERSRKKQDYPLLLPQLDGQLGRFNIDGNLNNVLILKFRETEDRRLLLHRMRNFNAPCEVATGPDAPNARLALAMLDIAHLRVRDVLENKINVAQPPEVFINLVHHAIEMRSGHLSRSAIG